MCVCVNCEVTGQRRRSTELTATSHGALLADTSVDDQSYQWHSPAAQPGTARHGQHSFINTSLLAPQQLLQQQLLLVTRYTSSVGLLDSTQLYCKKSIRISTDILWRDLHILTEPVTRIRLYLQIDLRKQAYTEPVPLKYAKLATIYRWIYEYFYSVQRVLTIRTMTLVQCTAQPRVTTYNLSIPSMHVVVYSVDPRRQCTW